MGLSIVFGIVVVLQAIKVRLVYKNPLKYNFTTFEHEHAIFALYLVAYFIVAAIETIK